jgi:hypothetical protein
MKSRIHYSFSPIAALAALSLVLSATTAPAEDTRQGTPFLYRGRLDQGTSQGIGNYDLTFSLCDTSQGGTAIAGPVTISAAEVKNGAFAITLDFGPGPFTGTNYWLDISARPTGSNAFTKLTGRQPLRPSPYAHGPLRLATSKVLPHQAILPAQVAQPGPSQNR